MTADRRGTLPPESSGAGEAAAPSPVDEARPDAATPIDGLALGAAAAVRSGEDGRRRGWFWHWNSLVTQYSPLLGLKGVGLLNSYTVWTDRREASPHRGYAFPSQQSEADFYGEDRAELITINKLLVVLDLIEIRKEMVLRTDPQGRRWRVPHNFYRVKDHDDDFGLSGRDVLRVAELADRDKAVYRHVRRVFSPRFAPIDGDNVWHRILPEVRRTEVWQRLAARAAAEEDRASARTRAGHAARRASGAAAVDVAAIPPGAATSRSPDGGDAAAATTTTATATGDAFFAPTGGDGAAPKATANDSGAVAEERGLRTGVDSTNEGLGVGVGGGNDGSGGSKPTAVEPGNGGGRTGVDPSNRTYHLPDVTTTTTPGIDENGERASASETPASSLPRNPIGSFQPTTTRRDPEAAGGDRVEPAAAERATVEPVVGAGPGARPPGEAPAEAAAIRAFEAANARPATPAERTLLRGLAERFAPAAAAAARSDPAAPASGWGWVAAATYEAVEAGSAFVAPRRLREILGRWERDGFPQTNDGAPEGRGAASGAPACGPRRRGEWDGRMTAGAPGPVLGAGPDLDLPHGHDARRTWAFAVGLLAEALDPATLAGLVEGTAIVGYRDGEVTLAAPDRGRAERLATTHRELVARKLSDAMRRPVRLAVVTEGDGGDEGGGVSEGAEGAEFGVAGGAARSGGGGGGVVAPAAAVDVPIVECGLPSGQVWGAVLAEVAAGGEVSPANFDAWLRPSALVGRRGEGGAGSALVVAVPHVLARRRVVARFLPALRAAVAAVVGAPLPIEVVTGGAPASGSEAEEADERGAPRAATFGG